MCLCIVCVWTCVHALYRVCVCVCVFYLDWQLVQWDCVFLCIGTKPLWLVSSLYGRESIGSKSFHRHPSRSLSPLSPPICLPLSTYSLSLSLSLYPFMSTSLCLSFPLLSLCLPPPLYLLSLSTSPLWLFFKSSLSLLSQVSDLAYSTVTVCPASTLHTATTYRCTTHISQPIAISCIS